MVAPTCVNTLHGSGSAVMTASGLATTPHGPAAGPVVVGPLVEVLLVGLPPGGMPDEPHALSPAAMAKAATPTSRRATIP